MEQRLVHGDVAELRLERAGQHFDDSLRAREVALAGCREMQPLDRQLAAARLVDTRDLEERDAFDPEFHVAAHRVDHARQKCRAQDSELRGDRFG